MSQHVISGKQNLQQKRKGIQAAEGYHVINEYRRRGSKKHERNANHQRSKGEKDMIFKYSNVALKLFACATRKRKLLFKP
jgi:hypothetical protein